MAHLADFFARVVDRKCVDLFVRRCISGEPTPPLFITGGPRLGKSRLCALMESRVGADFVSGYMSGMAVLPANFEASKMVICEESVPARQAAAMARLIPHLSKGRGLVFVMNDHEPLLAQLQAHGIAALIVDLDADYFEGTNGEDDIPM